MKVLRSTLVIAAAAFAAACGDKVTVSGPPTTDNTAKVNSVTVSPANVTLSVGQSVTFTPIVDVSNGAAQTVTWSSASAAVTVTAAGVATAVSATPGVAVCATSTADATKKGCANVVVTTTTNIPATVSIQSITTNVGGLNAPVNPAAVTGVIDVRVNVSPGTETVTKVVLLVGTTRADSQTFTAAQAAALRYAADEATANQSAFPPILFSINTAKFNATTGAVSYPNGNYIISVQLYTSASGTTARATATYATALTFINADTYLASVATSGTTGNALNAAGFRYDRGGIDVTVTPVIYTGNTVAAGTVTFGTAACDGSGIGARTIALVAPVAPSLAWTASFSATAAAGAGNVTNYEYTPLVLAVPTAQGNCTTNATGESVVVTATNGAGDALFAAAAPVNVSAVTSIRLDNRAPTTPSLIQNPNLRQNGWINAAVALNSANTSATSNGVVITGVAQGGGANCISLATSDCGVSGLVRFARIAASAAGLVDEARLATASSAAATPAPSLNNTTYCGIWTMRDAVGNESTIPAAGAVCTAPAVASFTATAAFPVPQTQLFGVDIAPPTIAFSGGLAANARINTATVAAEFQVTVSDTGTIGNSGMLSTSAVRGTVQIRNPAPQPAGVTTCFIGAGATCTVVSINAAPDFPLVATTTVAASGTVGYYFFSGFSQDAAGNQSAAVTRVIAHDLLTNPPTLTTALFNTPITGGSVTFNANASDNFELRDIRYSLTYGGSFLPGPLAYPTTTLSTFPTASAGPAGVTSFVNSNVPVPVTITNFIRQVESISNADCSTQFVQAGGIFKPSGLNGFIRDVVNVDQGGAVSPASGPVTTAIAAAAVTTGVSYNTIAAAQKPFNFFISNGVAGCSPPAFGVPVQTAVLVSTGATNPAANPTSLTLNIDMYGPTATMNSPFARVDVYVLIGGNMEQIGSTNSFTTVDDGSAFGRRHRYTLAWTPGTASPITGTAWGAGAFSTTYQLFAVGVSAAGDALVAIGTPAAAPGINITNP